MPSLLGKWLERNIIEPSCTHSIYILLFCMCEYGCIFCINIHTGSSIYNGCQFALLSYITVDRLVQVQLRTAFVPKYIHIFVYIWIRSYPNLHSRLKYKWSVTQTHEKELTVMLLSTSLSMRSITAFSSYSDYVFILTVLKTALVAQPSTCNVDVTGGMASCTEQ